MDIDIQRDRARSLRRNMTSAERKLWVALKKRALGGFRFQRQAEIGPYIADFLCRERSVVVEIDGATHSSESAVAADRCRTAYLEAEGYAVFRAWNADVYENLNGVLEGLLKVLESRQPVFRRRIG